MDTPHTAAQLVRLLHNLIRPGTITHVDHAARRVRVQTGQLHTDWIKWLTPRAGASRVWDPPSKGEHVLLLAPGGELAGAVALASLDSTQNPPPSTSPGEVVRTWPDGARFAYHHASGALTITGIQTLSVDAAQRITLKAGSQITLDAPQTTSTGQHTVQGLLAYLAGLAGQGGGHGTTITGNLTHDGGALSSNGVVLHLHVHTGVRAGGDTSGAPA